MLSSESELYQRVYFYGGCRYVKASPLSITMPEFSDKDDNSSELPSSNIMFGVEVIGP